MSKNISRCTEPETGAAEKLPYEISNSWCVDDVLEVDDSLTDHQARLVLQRVEEKFDANFGINWDAIEYAIDSLRGEGAL